MRIMKAGGRLLVMLVSAALGFGACTTEPRKEPAETPQPITEDTVTQAAAQTNTPATSGQEFVATEELYRRTFAEVQDVVSELTRIIAAGDYDGWLNYLTATYVKVTESPGFLAQASRSGVLRKSGTVLP